LQAENAALLAADQQTPESSEPILNENDFKKLLATEQPSEQQPMNAAQEYIKIWENSSSESEEEIKQFANEFEQPLENVELPKAEQPLVSEHQPVVGQSGEVDLLSDAEQDTKIEQVIKTEEVEKIETQLESEQLSKTEQQSEVEQVVEQPSENEPIPENLQKPEAEQQLQIQQEPAIVPPSPVLHPELNEEFTFISDPNPEGSPEIIYEKGVEKDDDPLFDDEDYMIE
jgi:hypothetical protein